VDYYERFSSIMIISW